MASPHTPYHPQPGPSYYPPPPPHAPPPHYPYSQAPGPPQYYPYPMPPMNGHAPMHQPASPRINGAGRGRFNPHRGGAPQYHYQHLPPQHHMPPAVPIQTPPPVSPASPFHHPQKFPPHPHSHQVPYGSPYHHPQPNGPYPPAWAGQTLSPLPKHLPMLPPMVSPEHVPQLQQPQPPHPPQPQPQPPPEVPPQTHPMPSNFSEEAIPQASSPQIPRVVTQLVDIPLPEATPAKEVPPVLLPPSEVSEEQPEQPEQDVVAASPIEEAVEEGPVVELEPRVPTPRSPSPPAPIMSDPSIFVVWSRRPRDPSHAPGLIISYSAFPPENVVQKALELRTPPASPKPVPVALVQPSTPPVQDVSVELSVAPSSSTTETTPAGSLVADTPVPGSPYSCATSISAAVESPSKALVSPDDETKLELPPAAVDVAPKESEPTTPHPPAEQPAVPVASTSSVPAPAAKVPSLPKKSWTSLFQSSDSAASTSKPRLPVSNVVGISVPAATGVGASSTAAASAAAGNRSELLQLLNDGPLGSSANFAAAMKIRPRGLVNTGNMCFANAVLQILIYCPPFHRFFSELKKHLAGPVVGSQREGTKATPLVDATIQFLKEFVPDPPANTNTNSKSKGKEREDDIFDELDSFIPTYVYDAMKEKKRFANMIGGHQEDAEEFLGFFLDTLEEELLSIAQSLQPKEPPKSPEEPQGDGWLEVGKKNKAVATRTAKSTESPITRIFGGKFRSTLRAPHQRESVTIEDWRSLQLDIQPENVKSLRDALQHISHPQPVQISIPTRPGALLDAQQQVLIDALPPVLILHMKRFLYDTKVGDVVKVGKQVSFASELDVPPDIISTAKRTTQPVKYELFGVLYHHGMSAHGGHYTLDVLHPNRELSDRPRPAWIRIDDELVSDLRQEDVFGGQEREDRQPYLLFYRRMTAWAPARTN
ncbi:hypothetical protein V8D89_008289 [Ganoderma adspersum]